MREKEFIQSLLIILLSSSIESTKTLIEEFINFLVIIIVFINFTVNYN